VILRDARGVIHDLGPTPARYTTPPSMMKMIGATGTTGTGKWAELTMVPRRPRDPESYRGPLVTSSNPCRGCGQSFETRRPDTAKYCKDACRWKLAKAASRARALTGDRGQGDALI